MTQAPGFWDDPKKAEIKLKEISRLKSWTSHFHKVATTIEDLQVLFDFYQEKEAEEADVNTQYEQTVEIPRILNSEICWVKRKMNLVRY